ncbi:PQQ-dependent sugar dehydrogenase [Thalassobacter stenotrophicus]|uniref:PQQ-dependent sugar dehydrogenase n=1 Tax=Thalassobacter stenotrophicus TaxID=266809 RepID=UPI0022A9650F|nr:PQQ-dependent sugar dehydrogenase [Thalassobacter stenotrophicus]UYP68988.1 PQQ-dependent sugar dehydrogenase [Thalassobacter stenotrophicus]
MRATALLIASLAALAAFTPAQAREVTLSTGTFTLTEVVSDLVEPWAVGFLPQGALLITERDGRLLHIAADGRRVAVAGVPRVAADGQGGLLDVMIPADFAETREVFLTFAKPQGRGAGTALARGELSADGSRLRDVRVVFEMARGTSGGRHFGSRVVEGGDGYLYLTIGDRGARDTAQDLSIETGTVLRIARDGRIPTDNPFADTPDARPAIWSYGHRNPQGAAISPDGTLYVVEHGARGGDEVNRITPGTNYGWPVISYGRHYSGFRIGEGTQKEGLAQPEMYWDPSIAPSGAVIHSGTGHAPWAGDLFVGSLKFDYISRISLGENTQEIEQITLPETNRVRDVREGPAGGLWFLSVGNGALYRLAPE